MNAIIPLRTYSALNQREHWGKRARRAKSERATAFTLTKRFPVPCAVTLTRIAPKALDDDNLRGALKAIRDGVADRLKVDDRDPRVTWHYGQERGPYAVRVEFAEPTLITRVDP